MSDTPGRTDRILAGINTQNDPAEFDGRKGFWVQADAVFIEAENPSWAISRYRTQLAENNVACSHNHFCGSILHAKANKETQSLERQLAEVRAEIDKARSLCEEIESFSAAATQTVTPAEVRNEIFYAIRELARKGCVRKWEDNTWSQLQKTAIERDQLRSVADGLAEALARDAQLFDEMDLVQWSEDSDFGKAEYREAQETTIAALRAYAALTGGKEAR